MGLLVVVKMRAAMCSGWKCPMVQRYSVKDSNPTTLEHLGKVYLYGDGETDSNIYIRNNISGTTSIY